MRFYSIIVAGGSGSRMKAAVPKQFLELAGKPVLMHTIEAFHTSGFRPEILLVLHPDFHAHWSNLCAIHAFEVPVRLVAGGEQRFHSVKNALDLITDESVIAVHDAVRPMISHEVIDRAYRMAEEKGNAVTALASKDSVRQISGEVPSRALRRETIFLVQTPQTFRSDILKRAYLQPFSEEFTDDASVVERSGVDIHLAEGDPQNLKITFPEDLVIAECLLSAKKNPAI